MGGTAGFIHTSLAVGTFLVWCQAQSGMRSYGPVFEEQPSHTLFPEGSAEEKVTLACRARANPPATYRNLLLNLGLFAAGVWVARNLTDIDLMAPQPVP